MCPPRRIRPATGSRAGCDGFEAGRRYAAYAGDFPWVPEFGGRAALASGKTAGLDEARRAHPEAGGLAVTAYLEVPTAGTYTFYLSTDTGAFVRLHDARLIDADFGYASGEEVSSGDIVLAAGLHPIRIHLRNTPGRAPRLELRWEGPEMTKKPIPAERFFTPRDGSNTK